MKNNIVFVACQDDLYCKYATNETGSWKIGYIYDQYGEIAGNSALAIDSQNAAHVVFISDYQLKYARSR